MTINFNSRSLKSICFEVCIIISSLFAFQTVLADIADIDVESDIYADSPETDDYFGSSIAMGDFNGNGLSDLAVGVSGEDVSEDGFGYYSQGAVNVFYSYKLSDHDHFLSDACTFCREGLAVAAGDFNNDGFFDLAVGMPWDDHSGEISPGSVKVYYGDDGGKGLYGNQVGFHVGSKLGSDNPIQGIPESGASWGSVLEVGLFNDDSYYDLAISAQNIGVWILYGSELGLTSSNNQKLDKSNLGEGAFGRSLASGDFNGDGLDDLAIGAPYANLSEQSTSAGSVRIHYSTDKGLSAADSEIWTQDTSGIRGTAEDGDYFGWALAAGDFDNNGIDDLAIGVPGENSKSGAINVIYGNVGGLSNVNDQIWHQDSTGIEGIRLSNDRFGAALAVGYFNQDEFADLAVGVPNKNLNKLGNQSTGAVTVLYSDGSGLTANGNKQFTQNTPGIPGFAEHQDDFGKSLAAGDLNGDGLDELAIGVPGEDYARQENAGLVNVLTGNDAGLNRSYIVLHQN